MITVVIPSRGRPESLAVCLESMRVLSAEFEVIVGIDDDDERAPDYEFVKQHKNQRLVRSPRHKSLGALVNRLADMASGDIVMMMTDDYRVNSPDWVEKTHQAVSRLPNKVGLVFPRDPILPGFPGVCVTTRKTRDILGYWTVDYFPFWYADSWWDELAILSGAIDEIDADVAPINGRGETIGLRDVAFWTGLYEAMRPQRVRDAEKIIAAAYVGYPDIAERMRSEANFRQAMCHAKVAPLRDPRNIETWKQKEVGSPSPRYLALKANGERIWEEMRLAYGKLIPVGG